MSARAGRGVPGALEEMQQAGPSTYESADRAQGDGARGAGADGAGGGAGGAGADAGAGADGGAGAEGAEGADRAEGAEKSALSPGGPVEVGATGWPVRGAPLLVHLLSLAGAFAFWAWLDRSLWFFGDEWDFLVNRGLGYTPASHRSIWFPHNEHWSTLPILLWRGLYAVFHLSSYWPYLIPLLLANVAIMHLVWRLCARHGTDPWISTAAVVLLGFLGAGAEDLAWAFQIGFVGAVFFGLAAIVALDLPRNAVLPPRRQYLASVALLASFMCSTLGDAMFVGAAVVAFSRYPRRQALRILLPPLAVYVLWFATVGRLGISAHSDHFDLTTFTDIPSYVWNGLSSALGESFNLEAAGTALLAGLAAWTAWQFRRLWTGDEVLLALATSAVAFYVLAAVGRDDSTVSPDVSRYIYVAMALLMPLVAKLLTSLGPWPGARVGAVVLLAFTALGNVSQAQDWTSSRDVLTTEVKTELTATGELVAAGAHDVSGAEAAPIAYSPNISVGDIGLLERAHLLPHFRPGPVARADLLDAQAVLAVGDWDGLNMTLSRSPLSPGHFSLAGYHFANASAAASAAATAAATAAAAAPPAAKATAGATPGRPQGGCTTFAPVASSEPVQVLLRIAKGESSASISLSATPVPSPASGPQYAEVSLVASASLRSAPVEVSIPAQGSGYLDDNFAGAEVALSWPQGLTLTACGLEPAQ